MNEAQHTVMTLVVRYSHTTTILATLVSSLILGILVDLV